MALTQRDKSVVINILDEVLGVKYNIFSGDWGISMDDDVNYMAKFNKT